MGQWYICGWFVFQKTSRATMEHEWNMGEQAPVQSDRTPRSCHEAATTLPLARGDTRCKAVSRVLFLACSELRRGEAQVQDMTASSR